MTIEELELEWEGDLTIDEVRLDTAALDVPKLLNKYLKIQNKIKQQSLILKVKYADLQQIKGLYYTGKMSQEELEEQGWEPFHLKVLRNDLKMYYETDHDLKKIKLKQDYNDLMESYLNSIISNINNRSYLITNAIKWKAFTAGE